MGSHSKADARDFDKTFVLNFLYYLSRVALVLFKNTVRRGIIVSSGFSFSRCSHGGASVASVAAAASYHIVVVSLVAVERKVSSACLQPRRHRPLPELWLDLSRNQNTRRTKITSDHDCEVHYNRSDRSKYCSKSSRSVGTTASDFCCVVADEDSTKRSRFRDHIDRCRGLEK